MWALLGSAQRAYGVMGCVTPAPDLATRSDIVVVGKVERVEHLALVPCPASDPVANEPYAPTYKRCGDTLLYVVTVSDRLRGEAPGSIDVHVAFPGVLSLTCDDRPAPEEMAGIYGALFLEQVGTWLWLVDGPDGIHGWWEQPSAAEIAKMRRVVNANPRKHGGANGR